MLCVECNTECEECVVCPDIHRICDECGINCDYVSVAELNTLLTQCNDSDLSIVHANVRSLNGNFSSQKFTTLETLICDRFNDKPDILCITETKLNSPSTISNISLPGYDFFLLQL